MIRKSKEKLIFVLIFLFFAIVLYPSSVNANEHHNLMAVILDDEMFVVDLNEVLREKDSEIAYNETYLSDQLRGIFDSYSRLPQEPSVVRTDNRDAKYNISEGEFGRTFDLESLREQVIHNLKKNIGLTRKVSLLSYVKSSVIYPEKKLGYFNFVKENLIASFSTKFNPLDRNRTENLRISTNEINDYVLMPEEVFSLNKVLGGRTYAKGYKDAGIFVNGVKSTGIAGGICQTSSTLFNALMLADLDLVERHRHSLPVPYLERGRDAAISGRQDLKVLNSLGEPIRIKAWIDIEKGELNVEIYGKEEKRIELVTKRSHEGGRNVYRTYKQYLNKEDDIMEEQFLLKDVI